MKSSIIRTVAPKQAPAKNLPTVLALRSMSRVDDADIMGMVAELVKWGTTARLILQLVGAGSKKSVMRMCSGDEQIKAGRRVTTLSYFMSKPLLHVEASYWLAVLMGHISIEGGSLTPEAFIRAYRHYRAVMLPLHTDINEVRKTEEPKKKTKKAVNAVVASGSQFASTAEPNVPLEPKDTKKSRRSPEDKDSQPISPDNAYFVGESYAGGRCMLTKCECGVYFMQSVLPVIIHKISRKATCPACALARRRNRGAEPAVKKPRSRKKKVQAA